MEFQVVIPVLISFAISVVLGPVIIPFLRKLKMGQTERTEGVQSHLKKAGTPTTVSYTHLLGIVGLPNVGKSTLFNSLTKAGAESANYPFCTIDPNVCLLYTSRCV